MPVSAKNIAKFKAATRALNAAISACINDCANDEYKPFAYLDGNDSISLLSGEFGIGEDGVDETVLISAPLNAACGDW
ncbi:hypothetical protein [Undibacterium oligocarboniphilum]|uniref:Uncharacterized protein n=1 Tax=Undibacterium oligocarboniphilum TaxID=666702 RepID=A0A850QQ64_9BURK|nr:hypothetical protein [Undibacterium oligocarboniphilum]MBC3871514.1 hypothetical protein [Undibacterium oligocarboniphilum]NVO78910.1 hypothetical protein [Undibacterium oligocarboniphilum]